MKTILPTRRANLKDFNAKFIRTDLASECVLSDRSSESIKKYGIDYSDNIENGIKVSTLIISSEEGEKIIGKPIGTYITVDTGKVWLKNDSDFGSIAVLLSSKIKKLLKSLCDNVEDLNIMIIGLGNRYITSDAIGPLSVKDIIVTRHIKDYDSELYKTINSYSISALAPGVVGQTGIETSEIIIGAAEKVSPDCIIAIDALASRSIDRLATTVQLSNTGIAPGSGIGNCRKAIDSNTLGIPVISIGVPTVVDSSTMIMDLLSKANIDGLPEDLESRLENGKSFFVTLKDSDIAIAEMSRLIASAINTALSKN